MEFLLLQQRIEVLSKTAVNMQRAVARLGLRRFIPSVDANVKLLPDDLVKGEQTLGKLHKINFSVTSEVGMRLKVLHGLIR